MIANFVWRARFTYLRSRRTSIRILCPPAQLVLLHIGTVWISRNKSAAVQSSPVIYWARMSYSSYIRGAWCSAKSPLHLLSSCSCEWVTFACSSHDIMQEVCLSSVHPSVSPYFPAYTLKRRWRRRMEERSDAQQVVEVEVYKGTARPSWTQQLNLLSQRRTSAIVGGETD